MSEEEIREANQSLMRLQPDIIRELTLVGHATLRVNQYGHLYLVRTLIPTRSPASPEARDSKLLEA